MAARMKPASPLQPFIAEALNSLFQHSNSLAEVHANSCAAVHELLLRRVFAADNGAVLATGDAGTAPPAFAQTTTAFNAFVASNRRQNCAIHSSRFHTSRPASASAAGRTIRKLRPASARAAASPTPLPRAVEELKAPCAAISAAISIPLPAAAFNSLLMHMAGERVYTYREQMKENALDFPLTLRRPPPVNASAASGSAADVNSHFGPKPILFVFPASPELQSNYLDYLLYLMHRTQPPADGDDPSAAATNPIHWDTAADLTPPPATATAAFNTATHAAVVHVPTARSTNLTAPAPTPAPRPAAAATARSGGVSPVWFVRRCASAHSEYHSLTLNSSPGGLFWLLLEHQIMLQLLQTNPAFSEFDIAADAVPDSIRLRARSGAVFPLSVFDIHQIIGLSFGETVHDRVCPVVLAQTQLSIVQTALARGVGLQQFTNSYPTQHPTAKRPQSASGVRFEDAKAIAIAPPTVAAALAMVAARPHTPSLILKRPAQSYVADEPRAGARSFAFEPSDLSNSVLNTAAPEERPDDFNFSDREPNTPTNAAAAAAAQIDAVAVSDHSRPHSSASTRGVGGGGSVSGDIARPVPSEAQILKVFTTRKVKPQSEFLSHSDRAVSNSNSTALTYFPVTAQSLAPSSQRAYETAVTQKLNFLRRLTAEQTGAVSPRAAGLSVIRDQTLERYTKHSRDLVATINRFDAFSQRRSSVSGDTSAGNSGGSDKPVSGLTISEQLELALSVDSGEKKAQPPRAVRRSRITIPFTAAAPVTPNLFAHTKAGVDRYRKEQRATVQATSESLVLSGTRAGVPRRAEDDKSNSNPPARPQPPAGGVVRRLSGFSVTKVATPRRRPAITK